MKEIFVSIGALLYDRAALSNGGDAYMILISNGLKIAGVGTRSYSLMSDGTLLDWSNVCCDHPWTDPIWERG
jgi:hypothetical protein